MTASARHYVVGLAAFAGALLFRYFLADSLGAKVPYLQFYPAIILAAWYGGLGPGILITALSAGAAMYFLLPPAGIDVSDAADQLSLGVFIATGLVISWLNERLHLAQEAQRAVAATALARAERLDAILNTTADGIIVIDASGHIAAFNRGAQELFGYPEEEIVGRNVRVLMPSPHHEAHDGYLERYLTTGEARIIGIGREVTGRRRDGTVFPVQLSVGEMRIGGERKFTGILRDLTRRVHLEDALGASEARWRAIVDAAVDGIIVIDAHGRIEAFNHAAERLFGYTLSEVLGRKVNMLMPSPHAPEHDGYLSRYLATGRATIIGIGRDVSGRRKDGTTFPLRLSVGEMTIQGERKFTGILRDLSTRVRMEEQLREQAALAKLGGNGGGHRPRSEEPARRHPGRHSGVRQPHDPREREYEDRQRDRGAHRCARSDDEGSPAVCEAPPTEAHDRRCRAACADHGPSAQRGPRAAGDCHRGCGRSPAGVGGSRDAGDRVSQSLRQQRARDAMQGKGTIRVAVQQVDTACQIAFVDGGPGIPPGVREKIFIPFFTTKSRGSGLGLPTVKRLVEAHNGQIAVDCPPGGGTTVRIRLPMGTA